MRLLGRYVFREILTSSLLGTLLATIVIFLQRADALFKALVGSTAPPETIAKLLLLALPQVLPFTIPFGVLIGILIGLGRMSGDGEIVAMRAAGIPSRKVIAPVLLFAGLGMGLSAWASLRLTPYSYHESARIVTALMANRLSAEIQPRVFNEDFENTVLYVDGVRPGPPGKPALWKRVFIADTTKAGERKKGLQEKADGPLITIAEEAIATSRPESNRIQLNLHNWASHEMGKDLVSQDFTAPYSTQALRVKPAEPPGQKPKEMSTRQLLRYTGPDRVEAAVELHQRFTFPVGCVMLALVGIPLGIATRKGGKSAAYLIALFLGFFCYWLSTMTLENVARQQRTLSVPMAIWLPNVAFFVAGVFFLSRMEKPGDRDILAGLQGWGAALAARFRPKAGKPAEGSGLPSWRIPLFPQLVDTYVLSNFLFYFVVILATFVSMFLVFNFFDLTSDMIKHGIPLQTMFTYLLFLTPMSIYEFTPICVLVAALANLGTLSKQNEVTAFRACGVSLFRLAMPLLMVTTVLSGALFAFDFYYLPAANLKQDKLRDQIKGKPTQTYYRPDRKWTMGNNFRIYYYAYFDPNRQEMVDANVYELQPSTFQLTRQIRAARARWSASAGTWVFEGGWVSDFRPTAQRTNFQVSTFPELNETPVFFAQENRQDTQMNFLQLNNYIHELQQSGYGYDTVKFEIQLYRKFSLPLFALIMAMIGVPFGFLVGNRGAMTGIGVSIAIALSYQATSKLFEKVGEINELQPAVAAWGPDVIFGLAGLYFLLRMKS